MNAREGMLDAAAQEMLSRGYAGSSLASIAARIELTKGALAREFPTKDLLASEVMRALTRTIMREHSVAAERFPASPARVLVRYLMGVDWSVRHQVQVAAATSLLSDRALPAGMTAEPIEAWREAVRGIVGEAVACGEIPPGVDAKEAARFLSVSNLGAAVLEVRSGTDVGADERVRANLRFALRAVGIPDVDLIVQEAAAAGEFPRAVRRAEA